MTPNQIPQGNASTTIPTQVSNTNSINIAASQDPSHPHFHINWGKVMGASLLGLTVYNQTLKSGTAATLEDPNNITQIVAGLSQIWLGGK